MKNSRRLSICTFNINGGLSAQIGSGNEGLENTNSIDSLKQNINYLCDLLRKLDLDIICLQEITGGVFNQIEYIANSLGYLYFESFDLSPNHHITGMDNATLGIGIISKYKIVDAKRIFFYKPNLTDIPQGWIIHEKGILVTNIITPLGEICIGTLHILPINRFKSNDEEEKARMWEDVDKLLNKLRDDLDILTGDFNVKDAAQINVKLHRHASNMKRVPISNPTHYTGVQPDQIFIKKRFKINSYLVLEDLKFSDHFPCIVSVIKK